MNQITKKQFLDKLDTILKKKVSIKIKSDTNLVIVFEKLKYEINFDVIKIQDENTLNKIDINLNNINFFAIDQNKIICHLNDEKDTVIEIKCEL